MKQVIGLEDKGIYLDDSSFRNIPYTESVSVEGVDFVWYNESMTVKMKVRNQYARISAKVGLSVDVGEDRNIIFEAAKAASKEIVSRERAEALKQERENVGIEIEGRMRILNISIGLTYPVARYESVKFDVGLTRHLPIKQTFEAGVAEVLGWIVERIDVKLKEIKEFVA